MRRLLLTGLAAALLAGAVWAVGRGRLSERARELEQDEARRSVERTLVILADELDNLSTLVEDYASWTDTYEFMRTRRPEYLAQALPTVGHSAYRLHALLLLDTDGRPVFGRSLDPDRRREAPLPAALEARLRDPRLRAPAARRGLIVDGELTLLVAARPVLTTEGGGPSRGTLLLGRRLDDWLLEKLVRATRFTLTVRPFAEPRPPEDFAWARQAFAAGTTRSVVRVRDADTMSGYALIDDLDERPALVLRVDTYRRLRHETEEASVHLAWATALSVAGGVLLGAWLARR